ncbi:MAG: hypothetical protein AAF492_30225, partial [Verrucomicrobiota bacterium]
MTTLSEWTPLDSHPAIWQGDELAGRDDWTASFAEADPESIRARLEKGSGAMLLKGFPLNGHDRDSARDSFRAWCAGLGT